MALPTINDFIQYTNKPLDNTDWLTNWQKVITLLAAGTYDIKVKDAAIAGNATVTGALAVTGTTALTGAATMAGALGVTGNITAPYFVGSGALLTEIPASFKNAIINGCGVIGQREDYTLVSTVFGYGAGDRFMGTVNGVVTGGVLTRVTTGAPCGRTGAAFHFSGVSASAYPAMTYTYFKTRIEGADAKRFKNKAASVSCRVYHDFSGLTPVYVTIRKANALDNFAAVTDISVVRWGDAATVTDTLVKSENVAMGDCSTGIEVEIRVGPQSLVNSNIYITEIQLEQSSVASDYEYKPYEVELASCLRYYERITAPTNLTIIGVGFLSQAGAGTTAGRIAIGHHLKRIVPTCAFNNTISVQIGTTTYDASGTPDKTLSTTERAHVDFTESGGDHGTANHAALIKFKSGSNYMSIDAEL